MTIKCLVVDDEPVARKGIAGYVEQVPFLQLEGTCKSAVEANDVLHREKIDLLFLDIQMPDLTGIEFMRSLENPPAVIFTTAYRDFAIEGFELNALDYLVKPISFQRFLKAANKAQSHFEMQRQNLAKPVEVPTVGPEYFFIKSDGQFIKIKLADVLYFEAADKYLRVVTTEREHLIRLSLRDLVPQLDEQQFWQVHRSLVVRASAISTALRDESGKVFLSLRGRPERLTASRLYAHLFKGM